MTLSFGAKINTLYCAREVRELNLLIVCTTLAKAEEGYEGFSILRLGYSVQQEFDNCTVVTSNIHGNDGRLGQRWKSGGGRWGLVVEGASMVLKESTAMARSTAAVKKQCYSLTTITFTNSGKLVNKGIR